MKKLWIFFLFATIAVSAQDYSDTDIAGEWLVTVAEVPNRDEIPQKDAVDMLIKGFTGAKFSFKGNRVFKLEFAEGTDDRIRDLMVQGDNNWIISEGMIKVGTEQDDFSVMHITLKEQDGKTYFLLPMILLEVEKTSNEELTEPVVFESTIEPAEEMKVVELVYEDIDSDSIVPYAIVENPPLGPECKAKWDADKQRKCTATYVAKFFNRKFNTELASELGISGKIRIKVNFVITSEGKVVNIEATGGPEPMNQNAMEVLSMLPDLTPGSMNGKPVNVSYTLPVIFHVVD